MEYLSTKIKELRTAHNLKVHDLAELLGVSENTVYAIENGQTKRPGKPLLRKLADILEVAYDDLKSCSDNSWKKYKDNRKRAKKIKQQLRSDATGVEKTIEANEIIVHQKTKSHRVANDANHLASFMKRMYQIASLSEKAQNIIFNLADQLV